MFVQIIKGRVTNREEMNRLLDRWDAELRPGATGFLGSTSGVADDGTGVAIVRFESAEAAAANGSRPEQSAWWSEMAKCYDGPVTFRDSTDVEIHENGDPDAATFVQVMEGTTPDWPAAVDLLRRSEPMLRTERPDLLGGAVVHHDDGTYTQVAFFTSEEAARSAEQGEPTGQAAELMAEYRRLLAVSEYFDLREPRLA